jgi:hypothetical protein
VTAADLSGVGAPDYVGDVHSVDAHPVDGLVYGKEVDEVGAEEVFGGEAVGDDVVKTGLTERDEGWVSALREVLSIEWDTSSVRSMSRGRSRVISSSLPLCNSQMSISKYY